MSTPDRDNPLFNQSLEKGQEVLRAFNAVHRTLTLSELAALSIGEMGLAAPVVNSQGVAVGAVHVSPPASRWSMAEAQKKLAPLVMECARAISRSISH